MLWQTAAAAVTGPAHIADGRECQDRFRVATSGARLIAVVADGAGSALHAAEGAAIAANTLINALEKAAFDHGFSPTQRALQHLIETSIVAARQRVLECAESFATDVEAFHSTILGMFADESGGVIFHIGDGAAAVIDINGYAVISPPENGKFLNQTFFFTQDNWLDHLRLTPFGAPRKVLLATDGAACFAFEDGYGSLAPSFFEPLSFVLSSTQNRNEFLGQLLTRDDAALACDDDKTIVWADLQRE